MHMKSMNIIYKFLDIDVSPNILFFHGNAFPKMYPQGVATARRANGHNVMYMYMNT